VNAISPVRNSLFILAADLDAKNALLGLLSRHQSLQTKPLKRNADFEIQTHPEHDSGCCTTGVAYLRSQLRQYDYAILLFDHHGSGRDHDRPEDIESDLDDQLSKNGWADRAQSIVISRELETWVWSQSPHLESALNWSSQQKLSDWLLAERWVLPGEAKPRMPKEALHAALGKQPKARFFLKLAEKVSFQSCQDRAFVRLRTALRTGFPATAPEDRS